MLISGPPKAFWQKKGLEITWNVQKINKYFFIKFSPKPPWRHATATTPRLKRGRAACVLNAKLIRFDSLWVFVFLLIRKSPKPPARPPWRQQLPPLATPHHPGLACLWLVGLRWKSRGLAWPGSDEEWWLFPGFASAGGRTTYHKKTSAALCIC